MKNWILLFGSLLLTACASVPPPAAPEQIFHDALFKPPSRPIRPEEIFAISPEMRRYVDTEIASQLRREGLQRGLLDALYRKTQLKLEYDAERTRNATEAFDARQGNCLSLVIMTSALAKHLGLSVTYQSVYTEETWTRTRDTYFASGHVNLTLGTRLNGTRGILTNPRESWTVDFLQPDETVGQHTRIIEESTIVAMYMNNRAAESLAAGDLDDAYAWSRASIQSDPYFTSGYNTLGVIYMRHGNLPQAEQVLAYALDREPMSPVVMHNMVRLLADQGRVDESRRMAQRLASIEPEPPFHYFDLGQAAMKAGDYQTARGYFQKEVARAPYHAEFHHWLAVAELRLGAIDEARKHLALAVSNSTTGSDRRIYAAKLDLLSRQQVH